MDTKPAEKSLNSITKKQCGSHETESDQTKNPTTNTKTLKSFLGAIQYFAKFIPNLSEKTDR